MEITEEQLKENYNNVLLYARDHARFWNEDINSLLHRLERHEDMSLEELREITKDFKFFVERVSWEVGGLQEDLDRAIKAEQYKKQEKQ